MHRFERDIDCSPDGCLVVSQSRTTKDSKTVYPLMVVAISKEVVLQIHEFPYKATAIAWSADSESFCLKVVADCEDGDTVLVNVDLNENTAVVFRVNEDVCEFTSLGKNTVLFATHFKGEKENSDRIVIYTYDVIKKHLYECAEACAKRVIFTPCIDGSVSLKLFEKYETREGEGPFLSLTGLMGEEEPVIKHMHEESDKGNLFGGTLSPDKKTFAFVSREPDKKNPCLLFYDHATKMTEWCVFDVDFDISTFDLQLLWMNNDRIFIGRDETGVSFFDRSKSLLFKLPAENMSEVHQVRPILTTGNLLLCLNSGKFAILEIPSPYE